MSETIRSLTRDELLKKANSLPLCPGVYIMYDDAGRVIYVGKSKKLKNRVSQYFQQSDKTVKTSRMVSRVADFQYMICKTEIEALSLENTLIKTHNPRYNIRLKDAKSYPYIKVTSGDYPSLRFTRKRDSDKARYFGPFTGVSTVFSIMDVLKKTFGIPMCSHDFPKKIGKVEPGLYYQMGQCCGVCRGDVTPEDYAKRISAAMDVLSGHTAGVAQMLTERMNEYAESLRFEAASVCRDAIRALDKLHASQQVVSDPNAEQDVFSFVETDFGSCLYGLFVREGRVNNHVAYLFGKEQFVESSQLSAFLCDFYRQTAYIPSEILIEGGLEEEDRELISEFLRSVAQRRVDVLIPERGHKHKLCQLAHENALEELRQNRLKNEQSDQTLIRLAQLLDLETVPERIESYDISNYGKEQITAGMIVYENGKFLKSDYRTFKMKTLEGHPDDYASMQEAISRRLSHLQDDAGSFSKYPDLILLDGGRTHVGAVRQVLDRIGIEIPVFGMVKDDYHKTRALCTDKDEISIAKETDIFTLIYKIQEEVHRYSITRMKEGKNKQFRRSSLESIPGIGPEKAKRLLAHFKSLSNLKEASEEDISKVPGISKKDAKAVRSHFAGTREEGTGL